MPGDNIFVIQADGSLVELAQQRYDSEERLQRLLADYTGLLAGAQIDPVSPRRWLLISREAGVPGEAGGTDRWSVDHLFLDQDGIPTLVEVKRSTDTRIRREVVGQMLDYAANAVVYWPVETIRARFESRCQADGVDPGAQLEEFLGPERDPGPFWEQVKTNLQAGRVRLMFVADEIPAELRRVVEFLNGQMNPAEVLALEVPQFVGSKLQTLVPRLIGRTEQARGVKSAGEEGGHQWNESDFFAELTTRAGTAAAGAARSFLEWGRAARVEIWWGRGLKDGSFSLGARRGGQTRYFLACWTYGRVEILFQYLKTSGPFSSPASREELRLRLNEIPGVNVDPEAIEKRPRIVLATLAASSGAVAHLLEVLEWMRLKIQGSPE
jgi:hypothetical protein